MLCRSYQCLYRLTGTSGMVLNFEILVVAAKSAKVYMPRSRVATTKISTCNAMPLVPVSLAFQHNSPHRQKKKGYERFTFFNIVKRQAAHIIEPICFQKGWVAPL